MNTEFYKSKAEEMLSSLEVTCIEFAKVIENENFRVPKKTYDSIQEEFTAMLNGYKNDDDSAERDKKIYSKKFINVKDDFISLVYAFDKEMPFYAKMMFEGMPQFSSSWLDDQYKDDCDKLKSYINKFIYYLSFYQN